MPRQGGPRCCQRDLGRGHSTRCSSSSWKPDFPRQCDFKPLAQPLNRVMNGIHASREQGFARMGAVPDTAEQGARGFSHSMIVGGIADHQRARGFEAKFFSKVSQHPGMGLGLTFIRAASGVKVTAQPRLIESAFKPDARFSGRNAHRNPTLAQGVENFAHPVE